MFITPALFINMFRLLYFSLKFLAKSRMDWRLDKSKSINSILSAPYYFEISSIRAYDLCLSRLAAIIFAPIEAKLSAV